MQFSFVLYPVVENFIQNIKLLLEDYHEACSLLSCKFF
jgi:hypothetical protein